MTLALLLAATLAGAGELAAGIRVLRERTSRLEAGASSDAVPGLTTGAVLVLGGAAVVAAGVAFVPFAAADALPGALAVVVGIGQLAVAGVTSAVAGVSARR